MTVDECVAWVESRIVAFSPDGATSGDVGPRLRQTMLAAVTAHDGSAFGFSFPADIRAESVARVVPLTARAVQTWRAWLLSSFGEEGRGFFERAALENGLTAAAPKTLRRREDVRAALSRLRRRLAETAAATAAWHADALLEADEAHGYAIAPPDPHGGQRLAAHELHGDPLPEELEALYAEMNGVWTGAVEPPGGEQPFDENAEYFLFVPLERLLERHDDRDDGLLVFDQHPDDFSWTMLGRRDGAVYQANKLARTPVRVARSLLDYLDLLARGAGRLRLS